MQGFQTPIQNDSFVVDGVGAVGTVHQERGLTYYEVEQSGHMVPQFVPWVSASLAFFFSRFSGAAPLIRPRLFSLLGGLPGDAIPPRFPCDAVMAHAAYRRRVSSSVSILEKRGVRSSGWPRSIEPMYSETGSLYLDIVRYATLQNWSRSHESMG
jgi:hypothetical protein